LLIAVLIVILVLVLIAVLIFVLIAILITILVIHCDFLRVVFLRNTAFLAFPEF